MDKKCRSVVKPPHTVRKTCVKNTSSKAPVPLSSIKPKILRPDVNQRDEELQLELFNYAIDCLEVQNLTTEYDKKSKNIDESFALLETYKNLISSNTNLLEHITVTETLLQQIPSIEEKIGELRGIMQDMETFNLAGNLEILLSEKKKASWKLTEDVLECFEKNLIGQQSDLSFFTDQVYNKLKNIQELIESLANLSTSVKSYIMQNEANKSMCEEILEADVKNCIEQMSEKLYELAQIEPPVDNDKKRLAILSTPE